MGIRQKFNDNPAMTVGVAAIVIIGAGIVAVRSSCYDDSGSSDPRVGPPKKQFFTTDDGPNPRLFADDATWIPPFDHDGKPAYRARVYRCPHGKQFVVYLERFNDTDRKRLQDAIDQAKARNERLSGPDDFPKDIEVKRPGDKEWIRMSAATSDRYVAIVTPVCPEGSIDGVEPVTPE